MHDTETPSLVPKKRRVIASAVIGALLLSAGFIGGLFVSVNGSNTIFASIPFVGGLDSTPPEDIDLSEFWKVWNALEDRYVPTATSSLPTAQERLYGAMQGLARSYGDPYTTFLPPQESEMFRDDINGNFEGVGMEIGLRNEVLTVIAPLKDTPAEQAGIESGDIIATIDGMSTDGMSADEAVKLIRGEKGTEVVFEILRSGELLTIAVERGVIEIPTINTQLRDDGVFVIELYSFTSQSPALFRQALVEFAAADSEDLVIDLRSNPGGFLEASVDLASWFLPTGKVVVTEDFGEENEKVYRSRGYNAITGEVDVAVLINGGSASASEILAGALKDHDVATLVGSQSFGKGSVQELLNVTSNTSLKVTVARWLTPLGTTISETGLTPDIEVDDDPETVEDEVLEAAAEALRAQ